MKVLVANLADGLSDQQRAPAIVDFLEQARPDVAIMPEAYRGGDDTYRRYTEAWQRYGYEILSTPYNDPDGRLDAHGLLVAIKRDYVPGSNFVSRMRMGPMQEQEGQLQRVGRAAFRLMLRDPETECRVQIVAMHGDDRCESSRLEQAQAVLDQLDPDVHATLIAGDLNATHGRGIGAAVLRFAGRRADWLAWYLPYADPGVPRPAHRNIAERLARMTNLASRLGEMATGSTLGMFEEAAFYDADSRRRPTMVAGPIRAQLDHVLVRGALVESANPVPVPFSDHHVLVATIKLGGKQL